ncbi:unnamed protein product [Rodentolepis nana]|uniref:Cadherin domain-containing protein n=1 Tax=Rodentolepis nana TaxID=102285 RepID=A0A158QGR4_RODNA|nr:unnamed protein product [Rodentolepis nana]
MGLVLTILMILATSDALQPLTYIVQEEVPRGTRVGKLAEDVLQMFGTYTPPGEKSAVNLKITNWQDLGPQHFVIDIATGYLVVNKIPDREALCPDKTGPGQTRFPFPMANTDGNNQPMPEKIHAPEAADNPCTLTLRVVYTPEPSGEITKDPILLTVNVIITDINDHIPMFPQSRINLELGEILSIPGETTITLPTASDPDAGSNGTLSYWIEHGLLSHGSQITNSSAFPFRLEGLADGNPLRLRLIQPLDYEKLKSYEFILCVEDRGTPNSLSSRLRIHIDVLDENDNIPIFSQSKYFIIINESLPRGSVLLDLRAQDHDSGQNGQVTFEFSPPMTEESKLVQQYFGVRTITPGFAKLFIRQSPDLDTGIENNPLGTSSEISVRRSRDFTLRVIATDSGSPKRHSSEATVVVRVLDVNDMTPKIAVTFLTSQGSQQQGNMYYRGPTPQRSHGTVMENVDRSLIAFVTVRDLDSGPWGQVTCRTDNDAFRMIPISGNAPESDSFEGQNEVEPRSANEEIYFKLMTQKPFDRETVQQVTFRIICVDNVYKNGQTQTFVQDLSPSNFGALPSSQTPGSGKQFTIVTERAEQLTGVSLVSVRILDENDCAPEFTQALYTFSEEENIPDYTKQPSSKMEGKAIGKIQAKDKDLDPVLTYSLLSNPQDAFSIDSKTGTLFIIRPFDREAFLTSTYEGIEVKRSQATNESVVMASFRAQVSDGKHTAETKIQVTITDVNDCPPIFEKTNYEFFVEENRRPQNGNPIGVVKAHDSDVGLNGKIVYSIQPLTDNDFNESVSYSLDYNPNRHFKIDPNTGVIHTLRPLDREQYIHHVFHVLAIDTSDSSAYQQSQGGKKIQFTATATVTVIVNDENDNSPIITFPASHTTLRVEVGAPAGHQIFTVTATDPDAAENGTVRYFLRQSTPLISDTRNTEEGNAKGAIFSIDEQTGIVLLTEKLLNAQTKYLLTIGAHDLGSVVQKNTSIAAIIHVVGKNQLENFVSSSENGRIPTSSSSDTNLPTSGMRPPMPIHRGPGGGSDGGEGSGALHDDYRMGPVMPLPHPPNNSQPFGFLTDRIIIFVLSSIFVVLLVVTVVLILLIRRRRFIDINANRGPKVGTKVSQIQNNITRGGLNCSTNTLRLLRNDDGNGGKAVLFRAGIPSDGTSHTDSEGRSIIASETYPVNAEDPYTLLKPLSRNHGGTITTNEMGYKTYNHCVPINSFSTLLPIHNTGANRKSPL